MFKEVRLHEGVDPEVGPDVSLEALQQRVAHVSAQLPPLLERAWCDGADLAGQDGLRGAGAHTLRFMNFNLLAEGLSSGGEDLKPPFATNLQGRRAKRSTFGGFDAVPDPEKVFDFSGLRRWRLLEEIFRVNPDVLAVEECDHFANFFEPALAKAGYQGAFAPKMDAPGISFGFYSDGVALFWKTSALSLAEGAATPLLVAQAPCSHVVATLRHRPSNQSLVVACTHLKAKPGATNELKRDKQISIVLEAVGAAVDNVCRADAADAAVLALLAEPAEQTAQGCGCFGARPKPGKVAAEERLAPRARAPPRPIVVLLGDFNTDAYGEAGESSSSSGGGASLPLPSSSASVDSAADSATVSSWSTQGFDGAMAVPRVKAWRGGALASAYPLGESVAACDLSGWDVRAGGAWSTWKVRGAYEARHQIDYIFVSKTPRGADLAEQLNLLDVGSSVDFAEGGLSRVVRVLAPPRDEDVPPSRLPCAAYPSDHLSIAADVAFD